MLRKPSLSFRVITRNVAGELADYPVSAPAIGDFVFVASGSRDDTVEIDVRRSLRATQSVQ